MPKLFILSAIDYLRIFLENVPCLLHFTKNIYIPYFKRGNCWKLVKILSEKSNRMETAKGTKFWRFFFAQYPYGLQELIILVNTWFLLKGGKQCIVSVINCFTSRKIFPVLSEWQMEGSDEELKLRRAFCFSWLCQSVKTPSCSWAPSPGSALVAELHHLKHPKIIFWAVFWHLYPCRCSRGGRERAHLHQAFISLLLSSVSEDFPACSAHLGPWGFTT